MAVNNRLWKYVACLCLLAAICACSANGVEVRARGDMRVGANVGNTR